MTKKAEKMTEREGKCEKMDKQKKCRGLITFTGTAVVLAIAVNLAIIAIKYQKEKIAKKKKDLASSKVRVNLSASKILTLANQIIAKSKSSV